MCRSGLLNSISISDYEPNEVEENFRKFIYNDNIAVGHKRKVSRWIQLIKSQYNVLNLTNEILIDAADNHKNIKGLGSNFRNIVHQYLEKK